MYRTRNNRPSRLLMTGTALTCTAFGAAVALEVQSADPNLHYARYQREYVNWLIKRRLAAQSGQSND